MNQAESYVVLADGYTVPKFFYDAVLRQILEIIPALIPGAAYMTKDLCGPDFWQPLSRGQKIAAGRCHVDMVNRGLVPLELAVCPHAVPKKYRLK